MGRMSTGWNGSATSSTGGDVVSERINGKVWAFGLGSLVGALVLVGSLMLPERSGSAPAVAGPDAVTFPPLDQLVHYTTVRRRMTRENLLTSRAALSALKKGQPVPVGTHFVLVDYQSEVGSCSDT